MKLRQLALISILIAAVGPARGGLFPTPIANASFEFPDLATFGSFTTGWALEVSANNFIQDEASASSMPQTAYGAQWGGMTGLGAIYQQVGTWNANSNYSVTLLAGDRSNKTWAGLVVELWAGGTALGEGVDAFTLTGATLASRGATLISSQSMADPSGGVTTGNWTNQQSFIFNTGAAHTAGAALWLRIAGTGSSSAPQGFVDNVTIQVSGSAPPLPNPLTQKLSFDAAGDLFLQLTNLTNEATSIVQESNDLTTDSWSNRYALSGMAATDLLIPGDKPKSFYRVQAAATSPVAQPNVVVILAEDSSKHWFDLFDPTYGTATPNITSLANSGLVFNNAFCNVAVCSAARSTLISGSIPTRIGTAWHRRTTPVQLSNGLLPFPAYLRKAGYYTTSSTKSDENISYSGVWDDAAAPEFGWRNRPSTTTPFYHVRTVYTSHESSIQTLAQITSPTTATNSINLYPIHPDTAIFRNTYAAYMDKIHSVDSDVGRIVSALQADGLLDNTFIFFIGDNGGVVAGSKGYIVNTGLHVPLVVRVPSNWQHLAPTAPNGRVDGFVNFTDLGPTIMNLVGLGVPKEMDGKPFLGPGITLATINATDEAFSSTDRFDETYTVCRSLQKGSLKYIRHYEPFYPYALYNKYRYAMEAQKEWKQMFDNSQLNAVQSLFFKPRQAEELYDLANDPFETNNLAGNPAYATTLVGLRTNLYGRVTGMPDVMLIPESVFLREGGAADPVNYGKNNQTRIQRYVGIADFMLNSYGNVASALQTHLASADPLDRYWALTVCAAFGTNASAMAPTVTNLVATEANALVLARAAVFLGQLGQPTVTVETALKKAVTSCVDKTDSLLVLNDATHLQDTLGYAFTTITSGNIVGSSTWLTDRVSHLAW
jgi:arylsulfatase A-like enzyme